MTIVRIGATKKYSDGWEAAFSKGKKKAATAPAAAAKTKKAKPAAKASAKKKTAKKGKK